MPPCVKWASYDAQQHPSVIGKCIVGKCVRVRSALGVARTSFYSNMNKKETTITMLSEGQDGWCLLQGPIRRYYRVEKETADAPPGQKCQLHLSTISDVDIF